MAFYLALSFPNYSPLQFNGEDILFPRNGIDKSISVDRNKPMNMISRFMNDESGATAIEYGLIAALIGVALITVLGNVGSALSTTFGKVKDSLGTANGTGGSG